MPLPQIWRRRKAGRIQPTSISLPRPIPPSEVPACFAPVSETPRAARPLSTASAITTATTESPLLPAPPPPSRPSRVVSRCAPCSCMPDAREPKEQDAEKECHKDSCSVVDIAYTYAAAAARRENAGERAGSTETEYENSVAKRLSGYAASLAESDVSSTDYAGAHGSLASVELGLSSARDSLCLTPTLSRSTTTSVSSSTDSLGPLTPYDVYDDPFAGPECWSADEEGGARNAFEDDRRDAFADIGRYAQVGRDGGAFAIDVCRGGAAQSICGVANVLHVMEKGGGQAMLDANAHWSERYRSMKDGPAPSFLPDSPLAMAGAGTLGSELSEAAKEFGWALELDLATPRAEDRGQKLPIHTFFTKHYWTPDYT